MTRLNRQRELLEEALTGINPFNAKAKAAEVSKILEKYIPNVEKMDTLMKKYGAAFKAMKTENRALVQENESLTQELKESKGQSIVKRMQELQLHHDYEAAVALLERIPSEILDIYAGAGNRANRRKHDMGR